MIGQYSASTLPALAACSGYTKAQTSSLYAIDGLERHEALESMFKSDDGKIHDKHKRKLELQSVEGIEWAFDRIKFLAPMADYPLEIETPVTAVNESGKEGDWKEIRGRIDYRCGDIFFDFKWRERDYTAQMAAYALGLMQLRGSDKADGFLLFGENHRQVHIAFSKREALDVIGQALGGVATTKTLNPSEYCKWCAHHLTCPAVLENVNKVVEYEEPELEKLESEFETNPDSRGRALRISKIVATWAKAYQSRSNKAAIAGKEFTGFELIARRGEVVVDNIQAAFQFSGLDEDEFIDCCAVSLSKIAEARARKHSIPLASSKRELKRILEGHLKQKETVYYLKEKPKGQADE